MKKARLIQLLEELAVLLEIDGANTFRSGAHHKAARALADFDGNLDELVEANQLTRIDGIGKGIAEKIAEFARTGVITELEEMRAKYSTGLVEMTRVPGLGPKKIRLIYEKLGIDSVGMLKRACEADRLVDVKGLGRKTQEKILEGIEQIEKFADRRRLDVGWRAATPLLEKLRVLDDVLKVEVAGSLRRWRESVKDLDFVAATVNPTSVMDAFTRFEEVDRIIGRGDTKASVMLDSGIQADLRCVSPAQFPFALLHFTGSKEHNTELRGLARDKGLKLNEYGLFPDGSEESLAAEAEDDVYGHLGLSYIPPERREATGEVESAAKGPLAEPIQFHHLRGLIHMHTVYSDGRVQLPEYVDWAREHDLEWMGISDHSKSLGIAGGLSDDEVRRQHAEIDQLNEATGDAGPRLLKGIECDILQDGGLDYTDDVRAAFEFVIVSVHTHFNLTEKEQTARVLRALEHPHTDCLGHMTGRLLLARDGIRIDEHEVIRTAGRNGVAIEINANPMRLDIDWRLLRFAVDQGVFLAISPDAHVIAGLEDTRFGLAMARKGGLTTDRVLNCLEVDGLLGHFSRQRKARA